MKGFDNVKAENSTHSETNVVVLPILYRYDTGYANTRLMHLSCNELQVFKETPKGWWIKTWVGSKLVNKWVSKTGRKRYAYETKELALSSFIERKKCMIAHLEQNLHVTKAALVFALEVKIGNKTDDESFVNPCYKLTSVSFDWV